MSGPLFADRAWLTPFPEDEGEIEVWLGPGEGRAEYVRFDLIAALPEVQALIAGAFEAAARQCWPQAKRRAEQVHSAAEGGVQRARGFAVRIRADELVKSIEALTPADAIAARDAMIAEAVEAVAEHWFHGVTGKRQLLPEAQAEIRAIAAAIRKRGEGK